jgi:hypothetical protein
LAKFQRLGPVWRKPNPKPWKQLKACAARANFFQDLRDSDPLVSIPVEILTEAGDLLVLEQSSNTYIVSG